MCEVNRERSCLAAASSVCDSTRHNGLVTKRLAISIRPSFNSTSFYTCKTQNRSGSISPKKTISGLTYPPHFLHVGFWSDRIWDLTSVMSAGWRHLQFFIVKFYVLNIIAKSLQKTFLTILSTISSFTFGLRVVGDCLPG